MNGIRPNLMEWAGVCNFEKLVIQHTLGLEIYSLIRHIRQDSSMSSSVYATPLLKNIALKRGFLCLYSLHEPYTAEFFSHIKDWIVSKFFYKKYNSVKVAYSISSCLSICGSLKACKVRPKCLFVQNESYFNSFSFVNKARGEQVSCQRKKKMSCNISA